ncbi:MAG: hypothetical protein M1819_007350 [Sarea resinae]|nr:MAG: hypothetical protein M1819_007350 [Sarea resinae]
MAVKAKKKADISTLKPSTENSAASSTSARVRLHISPLNPALLATLIPASVLPLAENISYHSIQTFPEKNYGYVDLPKPDADRMKKKYNGLILKGAKMHIEDARPEKRTATAAAEDDEEPDVRHQRPKKRKREDGVLPGVELPDGRRVQRAWTKTPREVKADKTPKDKKSRVQVSKHSTNPELLFRTTLPPNVASQDPSSSSKKKASERRGKNGGRKEAIVHEFTNTTKYSTFLRESQIQSGGKLVADFVEGKGWVDADGVVIEPEKKARRKLEALQRRMLANEDEHTESKGSDAAKKRKAKGKVPATVEDDYTSSSGSSAEEEEEEESEDDDEDESGDESALSAGLSSNSSSEDEATSSSDSSEASEEETKSDPVKKTSHTTATPSAPSLSSSTPKQKQGPTSVSQPSTSPPRTREIHPLEALFKRPAANPSTPATATATATASAKDTSASPKPPQLQIDTAFSFFDPDPTSPAADDGDVDPPPMPQTPFTARDMQARRIRSAAPTPDTEAIKGGYFGWGGAGYGDEQDDDDNDDYDGEEMAGGRTARSGLLVWDDATDMNTKSNAKTSNNTAAAVAGNSYSNSSSTRRDVDVDMDADFMPTTPAVPESGAGQETGNAAESAFAAWFWEHRGETNRAWKRRRREKGKEARKRANKKGGSLSVTL